MCAVQWEASSANIVVYRTGNYSGNELQTVIDQHFSYLLPCKTYIDQKLLFFQTLSLALTSENTQDGKYLIMVTMYRKNMKRRN